MAIIHKATLSPSKLELLAEHVAGISELASHIDGDLSQIGAYRFDDPEGAVGIETHLLTSNSGDVLHLPLTYRGAPLEAAEQWLLGTMEHSVLGTRWVYDGCVDLVYLRELVRTILSGGQQVPEMVETDDGPMERPASAAVRGSGTDPGAPPVITEARAKREGTQTQIILDGLTVTIRNALSGPNPAGSHHLTGTWKTNDEPTVLVSLS